LRRLFARHHPADHIRSYLTHRAKGAVLTDVLRAWTVPAVVGVAVGAVIAYFAPAAVFKIVFTAVVTSSQ